MWHFLIKEKNYLLNQICNFFFNVFVDIGSFRGDFWHSRVVLFKESSFKIAKISGTLLAFSVSAQYLQAQDQLTPTDIAAIIPMIPAARAGGTGANTFLGAEKPRGTVFNPVYTIKEVSDVFIDSDTQDQNDLLTAYTAASGGDQIEVQGNNQQWDFGNLQLPAKSGEFDPVIIISTYHKENPLANGVRASVARAANLPVIRANQETNPALRFTGTDSNPVGVVMLGFGFDSAMGATTYAKDIVCIGTVSVKPGNCPGNIVLRHNVWINPVEGPIKRQLVVQGENIGIFDNAFTKCFVFEPTGFSFDGQNITVQPPSKNIHVKNCLLTDATENIFFGIAGADNAIGHPYDVTIDGCEFTDTPGYGTTRGAFQTGELGFDKCAIEFKGGCRVHIKNCVIHGKEINSDGQPSIHIKNNNPYDTTQDIILENIIGYDMANAIGVTCYGPPGTVASHKRIVLHNICFICRKVPESFQTNHLLVLNNQLTDVTVSHCTLLCILEGGGGGYGVIRVWSGIEKRQTNMKLINTIIYTGGVDSDDGCRIHTDEDGGYFDGDFLLHLKGNRNLLKGNIFIGADASEDRFTGNGFAVFPATPSDLFQSVTEGSENLTITDSTYIKKGYKGKTPGANWTQLAAMRVLVEAGTSS